MLGLRLYKCSRFNGVEFDLTDERLVLICDHPFGLSMKNMLLTFFIISDDNSVINDVWDFQLNLRKYKSAVR